MNITGRHKSFGIVALAWLTVVVLVSPWGNFPVNDDWAYARTVLNFSNGHFVYSDWQGMPFLTQALWGVLWVKVFGFSFTMLRISMLPVVLVGGWYMHSILAPRVGNHTASFACALLLFTPLSFHLTLTYMTDWFALTMALAASFHLYGYHRKDNFHNGFIGTIFVLVGCLCRQTVLIIPAAMLMMSVTEAPKKVFSRCNLFLWIALLLPLIVLYIHDSIMPLPVNYGIQFAAFKASLEKPDIMLLRSMAFYMMNTLSIVGVSLLPLTLLIPWKNHTRVLRWSLGLGVVFILRCFTSGIYWPFTGDIWHPRGIGPWLIDGGNSNFFVSEPWFGILVGLIGTTSFSILVARRLKLLWILVAILFIFPLSFLYLSDRYTLPMIAFLIISVMWRSAVRIKWAIPTIIATAIFSMLSQRAYFGMRDVQLGLTHTVVGSVDAGFEWNGWHRFSTEDYQPEAPESSWNEDCDWRISLHCRVPDMLVRDSLYFCELFSSDTIWLYMHEKE
jgi:hypothetical protein